MVTVLFERVVTWCTCELCGRSEDAFDVATGSGFNSRSQAVVSAVL